TPRRSLPSVRLRPELGFGVMLLNSGSFSKLADMDVVPDSPYPPDNGRRSRLRLRDVNSGRLFGPVYWLMNAFKNTGSLTMATKEQLRALITAKPFRPFLIKMASGERFTIRHPENAACDRDGRSLTVYDDEMQMVEMLLVEIMEPVSSA